LPRITVSIGYTAYTCGDSAESFIQRADLALYDAKHGGKNTIRQR
jgi:PleD family two-component response regulator